MGRPVCFSDIRQGDTVTLDFPERTAELKRRISEEIQANGPVSFARFMKRALYEPGLGYYMSQRPVTSRRGDFLTAPETHPAFGALLADGAREYAEDLNVPEFTVVEQGSGSGALARSFVERWSQTAQRPLRYVMVDFHPPGMPAPAGVTIGTALSLDEVVPFEGLFLSNELPDAFPVHRVRRRGAAIVEVYVDLHDGDFIEIESVPSSPELEKWLGTAGIVLADGAEIEVNLQVEPWMRRIWELLVRGRVITIDYGFESDRVSRFPRGTLLAHYRHTTNEDYLQRVGEQDLTAHVCWTALEEIARRVGFRIMERVTQREYLSRLGWKEWGMRLLRTPFVTEAELESFDRLGSLAEGMGGNGVLVLDK
jgi:SAM-dependent MidA family methyltransferase